MRFLLRPLLKLTVAAVAAALLSPVTAAGLISVSADVGKSPSGGMVGLKLSPAQVATLRHAYDSHRSLSVDQARQAITDASRAVSFGQPALAGYASSYGDCSYMNMYGYDWGYYSWHNHINDWMPPGSFGEIQFSTNGWTASVSDNWVGGGRDYGLSGNVTWVGWGATGTTMSGWTVLTDGTYCSGSLFAQWP